MAVHKSKKGLDLPVAGEPESTIDDGVSPRRVALFGEDYPGLRPTMHVGEGDVVRRGQLLFEDKKNPGVRYTSPGSGRVTGIHRGDRRAFVSLVVELDAEDRSGRAGTSDQARFDSFTGKHPNELGRDDVRALLVESGEWTALRVRPFGTNPRVDDVPHSIFVTAMDTNPLAPSVEQALEGKLGDFERGLLAIAKLTDGPVYVCTSAATDEAAIPVPDRSPFRREQFAGPHPSGTPGYHIHVLDPVDRNKQVWHVEAEDVAAIGRLFDSGELALDRVISFAGPAVQRPRLARFRRGGSTQELLDGGLATEGASAGAGAGAGAEYRVLSGSVLFGRTASGDVDGYLGRYHRQVSVLREGREREFLGWLSLGANKFSVQPAFVSRLVPGRKFSFTTAMQGSPRAIVPIGSYEKVFPMDLHPTFLLRALVMTDIERAEYLGCLELVEEDLALCSFVCPGKEDYGVHLRRVLTTIQKEG
jgi:Na+-transporting NADH:ubiquinone oxidoreductase subunit A